VSWRELKWSEDVGSEYIQFLPISKQNLSTGSEPATQNTAKLCLNSSHFYSTKRPKPFKINTYYSKIKTQPFKVKTQRFKVETQRFKVETQRFKVETQRFKVKSHSLRVETQSFKIKSQT
jgi:hypothetical protein